MRIEEWIDVPERDQSTARADLAVARLAARQHGVVSVDDLRACGLTLKAMITTPERTLLDLAGVLDEQRLRRAMRQSQFLGLTTLGSLVAILRGPGPKRGRKAFANVIAAGAAPTRSELEDAVLDLLLRGGFAHPLVNAPLFLSGRRIVPDFLWPEQRLVLEADGAHHEDPFERIADSERQRILEAHGFRVIRVTWAQAIAQPGGTLRRCREADAPRAVD